LQSKKTSYITEKVNELGKLLDLNDQLDKIFKYLSGGEQQRVAIAAALASHPNLLLMDEPFNQTDMFLKSKLKVHLQKIVKQLELSIFFVTHDPQDALGFADEILILDKGKILEKGKSWKLYYEPKKESTAILTGYCNWLPIKDFTSYPELHRINNNYLVRPDQIIIDPVDLQESFVAKVVNIYFHGLYQLFHLKMKRGNFLTASQSTNNFNIKVGQEVNISFIRKHK
jgi:ABC-type Fe3+/spermidine/putrescine transport system ATPase subunit